MAKKIGIIVLLCFSLCVGGVSAFANEGHDETDTQTLIETQPPVSSVLFRQDGADIQQSTDEGKTWQSYSPIEETDYFTYDEFSAWIENETENIQKWSMLENGQKQKRQKHLSITMKSLNLF